MNLRETSETAPSDHSEATLQKQVPAISIEGVDKTFRRRGGDSVKPVDGVTLDVHHGELVVLLGPSGCGKTTLLRCVAGLERPDAGAIRINGSVVYSEDERVFLPPNRRRLSMIFQSYALWPHMSVAKNVSYPLESSPERIGRAQIRERVEQVLQTTGLGGLGDQFPGQLSGGQQQRVALARALVANPDVVLFDEPLSNVDAQVREQLRVEILSMQRELGFAALYVTHDQAEAMELGHRIAVLRDGRVEQVASPREVYRRPTNLYVASFIGTTNVLAATARNVDGGRVEVSSAAGTVVVEQESIDDATRRRLDETGSTDCLATFRPESIELQAVDPSMASSIVDAWSGEIQTAMFIGSHVEYLVVVGGERVRVWTSKDQHLEEGTTVTFGLDPTRVLVMAPEDQS